MLAEVKIGQPPTSADIPGPAEAGKPTVGFGFPRTCDVRLPYRPKRL